MYILWASISNLLTDCKHYNKVNKSSNIHHFKVLQLIKDIHILIAVLHILTIPIIAAFCNRCNNISISSFCGKSLLRLLEPLHQLQKFVSFVQLFHLRHSRLMYFVSFSFYALCRFVSNGTVISIIVHFFSALFHTTMPGLFFPTLGVVWISMSYQISNGSFIVTSGGFNIRWSLLIIYHFQPIT